MGALTSLTPPRKSSAALFQYALIAGLVILLVVLLASGVSAELFTLVFLLGIVLAALPAILARLRRQDRTPAEAQTISPPQTVEQPAKNRAASAQPQSMGFSIRPLVDADLIETASVLRRAFEEYRGALDPPSGAHEENAESLRAVLKDSRALVAVISESREGVRYERIAGCVFYQFVIDHVYLFRLAVAPEYRRRGIASALIEQVEIISRGAGVTQIQLGVRTALPANQAYYERRGYRVLRYETHKDYLSPTVVILEKQV